MTIYTSKTVARVALPSIMGPDGCVTGRAASVSFLWEDLDCVHVVFSLSSSGVSTLCADNHPAIPLVLLLVLIAP